MRTIILGCFLFSQQIFAAVFCPMNSTQTVFCEFSLEHHNRILIEGGSIKKIIYPEDQLYVRLEKTSGQAFIRAKQSYRDKVLLSVISTGGIVQDIESEFKEAPSQVVVLRVPTEGDSLYASRKLAECMSSQACEPRSIVTGILKGEIPPGYRSTLITQSTWKIRYGVQAKLIGCLEGNGENLFLYQVRNTNIWKKRISESDFKCAQPSWVFVQEHKLGSKETTLAIVAVQS